MENSPAFCTCSSLLACSRMDLMASSEPASGVRTRAVMLPAGEGGKKTEDGGGWKKKCCVKKKTWLTIMGPTGMSSINTTSRHKKKKQNIPITEATRHWRDCHLFLGFLWSSNMHTYCWVHTTKCSLMEKKQRQNSTKTKPSKKKEKK